MDEYAALRVVEAVQNLNMQLLVAKKPFRSGAQPPDDDSVDDAVLEKDDQPFFVEIVSLFSC